MKNTSVDAIGINGGAMHALWTLKGLGEIDAPSSEAYRGGGRGAEASGRGRAQGGGDGAAEDRGGGDARCSGRERCCRIADLHTRLAATLVIAEMPESADIGTRSIARARSRRTTRTSG